MENQKKTAELEDLKMLSAFLSNQILSNTRYICVNHSKFARKTQLLPTDNDKKSARADSDLHDLRTEIDHEVHKIMNYQEDTELVNAPDPQLLAFMDDDMIMLANLERINDGPIDNEDFDSFPTKEQDETRDTITEKTITFLYHLLANINVYANANVDLTKYQEMNSHKPFSWKEILNAATTSLIETGQEEGMNEIIDAARIRLEKLYRLTSETEKIDEDEDYSFKLFHIPHLWFWDE